MAATTTNSNIPASEAIWIQKPGSVLPRVGRFVGAEFPVRSLSVNSDGMPADWTPPQTPPNTTTSTLIAEQFMNGSFVGDRRRRTMTMSSFDTNNNSLFGETTTGQFSPPSPKLPIPPEAVGTVSSSVPRLFRRSNSISVTNPSTNVGFNRMKNSQIGPISGSPISVDLFSDVFKRSLGQFFSTANGGTSAANHHQQQQQHSSSFNHSDSIPTGTSHAQANSKPTSAYDFTAHAFTDPSAQTGPTNMPFPSNPNSKMADKTNTPSPMANSNGDPVGAAKQNRKVLTDRVVSLLCENAIR